MVLVSQRSGKRLLVSEMSEATIRYILFKQQHRPVPNVIDRLRIELIVRRFDRGRKK